MRAVVTGGGSGLGRAIALELAERGARILVADIRDDNAEETTAMLHARGAIAAWRHCDVSKLSDVEALKSHVEQMWGGVDLLVNNAGVAVTGHVDEVSIENWQFAINVNLWESFTDATCSSR